MPRRSSAKKQVVGSNGAVYKVDAHLPLSRRAADFLNWCAENRPGESIAYNVVAREIMGYSHTPRLMSDDVTKVKGLLTTVKKYLQEDYKRGLVVSKGVGVRATVDDLETTSPRL